MDRARPLVLSLIGLVSAFVGAFIGLAFALPALGLNRYARSPIEVTVVAEGVAAALYLFGAVLKILGGRLLAQRQPPSAPLLLLLLAPFLVWLLVGLVVPVARNGDWEAVSIELVFFVVLLVPITSGLVSVWMGYGRRGESGSGPARRRSGRHST